LGCGKYIILISAAFLFFGSVATGSFFGYGGNKEGKKEARR